MTYTYKLSKRLALLFSAVALIVGCADAPSSVSSANGPPTTPTTPTAPTTGPGPSSGSYPNEPAGAVALLDYDTDFSNLAGGVWSYVSGESNLSTVTDATAPVNPSKVGRVRFSPGCCDGTGPARLETSARPPANWSQWYVSDWIKFDPSWKPNPCCQKIFEFFWAGPGGDNWLIIKADNNNSGNFPLIPRLTTEFTGNATGNLPSGQEQELIQPGVWYQYEVIVHRTGRVQFWIRPQGGQSVNLYDGSPTGFGTVNSPFLFWWWGYGGLGAYPGTVPSYIYHNHFHVSYTP